MTPKRDKAGLPALISMHSRRCFARRETGGTVAFQAILGNLDATEGRFRANKRYS